MAWDYRDSFEINYLFKFLNRSSFDDFIFNCYFSSLVFLFKIFANLKELHNETEIRA
ncbi:hypothetical protein [Chlamydia felis Fe/C-56]|uniref:Uncharacterized protein n=1 Tax=Chlamydia felis (strain Fe/C-56) TaxID=264202 RepID=Q253D7_CHLFF|nr:hypothetical protein [Chlamydia felis Fe/C-56]